MLSAKDVYFDTVLISTYRSSIVTFLLFDSVSISYYFFKNFIISLKNAGSGTDNTRTMNIDIEVLAQLIKSIRKSIEFLEANDTDNADLDELKLLLSDNLSKEGKIHIRPSLLNIEAHYYVSNCTEYLKRYEKECLCN